jgi:hypothetical protein
MAFSTSFVAGVYGQGKVKKNLFLEEMEQVMPWELLVSKLEKRYKKGSKK